MKGERRVPPENFLHTFNAEISSGITTYDKKGNASVVWRTVRSIGGKTSFRIVGPADASVSLEVFGFSMPTTGPRFGSPRIGISSLPEPLSADKESGQAANSLRTEPRFQFAHSVPGTTEAIIHTD